MEFCTFCYGSDHKSSAIKFYELKNVLYNEATAESACDLKRSVTISSNVWRSLSAENKIFVFCTSIYMKLAVD